MQKEIGRAKADEESQEPNLLVLELGILTLSRKKSTPSDGVSWEEEVADGITATMFVRNRTESAA